VKHGGRGSALFLVRLWDDVLPKGEMSAWRGRVVNVASGAAGSFLDLASLVELLLTMVEDQVTANSKQGKNALPGNEGEK